MLDLRTIFRGLYAVCRDSKFEFIERDPEIGPQAIGTRLYQLGVTPCDSLPLR